MVNAEELVLSAPVLTLPVGGTNQLANNDSIQKHEIMKEESTEYGSNAPGSEEFERRDITRILEEVEYPDGGLRARLVVLGVGYLNYFVSSALT